MNNLIIGDFIMNYDEKLKNCRRMQAVLQQIIDNSHSYGVLRFEIIRLSEFFRLQELFTTLFKEKQV